MRAGPVGSLAAASAPRLGQAGLAAAGARPGEGAGGEQRGGAPAQTGSAARASLPSSGTSPERFPKTCGKARASLEAGGEGGRDPSWPAAAGGCCPPGPQAQRHAGPWPPARGKRMCVAHIRRLWRGEPRQNAGNMRR